MNEVDEKEATKKPQGVFKRRWQDRVEIIQMVDHK
jgi:hypothetical protein